MSQNRIDSSGFGFGVPIPSPPSGGASSGYHLSLHPILGSSSFRLTHLPSLSTVAAAQTTPGPCSGCGPLSLPLLVGLVAADAVLSLLTVGVVFMCARPRHQPMPDDKIYINMPVRG
ncbi:hematopoietic cell signal transducer isoform X2 [Trichechus manatus latirostris]|uniref:Hematopoietic cell signal transducer n=1 Tax=Trichechus manatus latirostris TaxID=127582 RepID=A0A2Y9S1Q6_TRIMA|nr:hematopoietic cell signal transducer isoform X2 [Trichechus manatus latirostris]